VRGHGHVGTGRTQGDWLATPQRCQRVGLMRPERLAGERDPGLGQLGLDRQVADALAGGGLELEQRDLRRRFAAPTLPSDCLDDLDDALHRLCAFRKKAQSGV
jgi:hypothetical protein